MRDFAAFVRRHLPSAGLPAQRYDAIVEELASELEARYTRRLNEGATEQNAWNAAVAEIPSWTELAKALSDVTPAPARDVDERRPRVARLRGALSLDHWTRDIRTSWRTLRKDRGFAAATFVTLAIGLGGHAAMVAAVNRTLLHPLNAPEPERVLLMANQYPRMDQWRVGTVSAPPDYEDRRQHVTALEDQAMYNFSDVTIDAGGVPARLRGIVATPSLFRLLRAQAAHGRLFVESEATTGNDRALVLTDGLWRELYGGDPDVVGRAVRLSGRNLTVVGVLPPGFAFGGPDVRFYTPLAFTDQQRSDDARHSNGWYNIGRLKHDATIEQARAQLEALDAGNLDRQPNLKPLLQNAGFYTSIERLQDVLVRDVRGPLTLLWGAALVVFVVGVANVVSLAVARSRARLGELGTRLALGARRSDILRQFMVEGLLLAAAAMSAGLLLTWWLLSSFPAPMLAGRDLPQIEMPVIAVTGAAAILAGIAIALAGAFPLLKSTPGVLLQDSGRSGAGGRTLRVTRRTLVVGQIACAFVLLVGAGLLWISLRNLLAVDTGFQTDGVITAGMSLPGQRYVAADDARAFVARSLAAIRGVPGVSAAGVTTVMPLSGNYQGGILVVEGYIPKPDEPVVTATHVGVTPGYFEAVGTALVKGRYFDERDNHPDATTIIIDEGLAQRFWPNDDPIGRRVFRPDNARELTSVDENTRWLTVIGVVRSAKLMGPAFIDERAGTFYLPYAVAAPRAFGYVVRSHADTTVVINGIRSALLFIDRETPLFDVRTMAERASLTLLSRTSTMLIAAMFAAIALFLSLVGLYGTLAYLVSQRRREFGVRVAVGGTPQHILGLVLREGVLLSLAGVIVGGGATLALRQLLTSQLFGIGPSDPRVLLLITISLTAVAVLASLIPARRATHVDVMQTLKTD
jgi:predicted permease